MSDPDLATAFDALEARAAALGAPPDRISLREHIVEADIGAFAPERGQGQRLRFAVVVEVRPAPAPLEDDVDRILSYDRITEAIAAELAAERLNLLETLAERIAARILAAPQAARVFLRIEKLDRGPGALGVEIVRQAGAPAGAAPAGAAGPGPRVLALGAMPERLGARLDAQCGAALLLVPPLLPGPFGAVAGEAGRRIALLAREQAAFALAAQDPRCTVAGTRTEIDWALRRGQVVVWAPAKLVLDAPGGAALAPQDDAALAAWIAALLGGTVEGGAAHDDVAPPAETREGGAGA